MYIDLSELSKNQVYHTLVQSIVPRPIAWVLTENSNQTYNLAPFSYFNGVCSDPPLIMLSIGKKADGSPKDTLVNIKNQRFFNLHIADQALAEPLNETAATLEYGQSELAAIGLKTVTEQPFSLPRLVDCKIAFMCEYYDIQNIGNTAQALVLGKINHIYLNDKITSKSGQHINIDVAKLDPLARLGGTQYASLGNIFSLNRPK